MFDSIVPSKRSRWRLRPDAMPLRQPWRWPLQPLGRREPIIVAEHVDNDRRGVDLGYEARAFDAELYVPVYAAQDGEVMFAGESKSGFIVSLDHGERDWATYYAHMSKMFVASYYGQRNRRRQRIRGGDVIGYAAKSPLHVRFELWNWTHDRGFVAVDPIEQLTQWIGPLAARVEPVKQAA